MGKIIFENTFKSDKNKGKRYTNFAYYEKDEKYICIVL